MAEIVKAAICMVGFYWLNGMQPERHLSMGFFLAWLSGLEHYLFKGRLPFTLKHGKPDHEATHEASVSTPIKYTNPDGIVSFDVPTSLYSSNTIYDHGLPAHLRLRDPKVPQLVNLPKYGGP